MHPKSLIAAAALLSSVSFSAQAIGIVDATGDFLPSYTGVKGGDLDVVGAFVTFDPKSNSFVFAATLDASVGSSAGGFYVFGVNRGAGTAAFAGAGLSDVLFDRAVVLRPDGTGAIGSTAITSVVVGSTILAKVDASLLPSTGFAPEAYTWNLWTRMTGIAGFAGNADFAPNAVNTPVTVLSAVPEPATALMLGLGLGAMGLLRRRQR